MRYKLTIEYDGSDFAGWQKQENAIAVQNVLESAIEKLSGETVNLHCAGRTDAGVHAIGQVAHADLARADITPATLRAAVNVHVRPHRVAVLDAEIVDENFHARFSAKSRAYRYQICNRRAPPAIAHGQAWHRPRPLDIAAMQAAAAILIGKHDFSTFRAANCQAKSPERTLDMLEIARQGEMILFTVRSRSFLYHQVRNMVGTLSLVGAGRWSFEDFKTAFKARDRAHGGPTAPPQGLFFLGAEY